MYQGKPDLGRKDTTKTMKEISTLILLQKIQSFAAGKEHSDTRLGCRPDSSDKKRE